MRAGCLRKSALQPVGIRGRRAIRTRKRASWLGQRAWLSGLRGYCLSQVSCETTRGARTVLRARLLGGWRTPKYADKPGLSGFKFVEFSDVSALIEGTAGYSPQQVIGSPVFRDSAPGSGRAWHVSVRQRSIQPRYSRFRPLAVLRLGVLLNGCDPSRATVRAVVVSAITVPNKLQLTTEN
jgi:hypothetical protein